MSTELESIWGAMKDVHYRRTIDQLRESIQEARDLPSVLVAALDTVVTAVHAQAGTLWVYDRFGDGRIHPDAVYGGGKLEGISLLPGEGIAGQVVESGKSVIIQDCQQDPRWAGKVDSKTGFRTETMICVPLRIESSVFGCIQIINKTDGVSYDEKDLSFAELLATEASQLFLRQGMLNGYVDATAVKTAAAEEAVTFMEVFGTPDDREMEYQLHRMDEFARLRVNDQEQVIRLASQLRVYFGGSGRRRGLFRR